MIGRRSLIDIAVHPHFYEQMSKKSSRRLSQRILNDFLPDLKESTFYQQDFRPVLVKTLDSLRDREVERIICYGLGSFHSGTEIASRYQLALLLMIYDELVNRRAPISNVIEIFDPSFEPEDLEALQTFPDVQFKIIEENEHCARKITSHKDRHMTLVYMPHLDKHFYNNLLGANWYNDCINRLLVLGNSFSAMIDYEIASVRKSKLHYMNLLVNNFKISKKSGAKMSTCKLEPHNVTKPEALSEFIVDSEDVEYREIFNNFAFHFIDESWMEANKHQIEQSRLIGWERVVSSQSDNEWTES